MLMCVFIRREVEDATCQSRQGLRNKPPPSAPTFWWVKVGRTARLNRAKTSLDNRSTLHIPNLSPTSTMSVKTSYGGSAGIERVYNAKSVDEVKDAYNEWAEQFDGDIAHQDYVAPMHVARALVDAGANMQGLILDAGCGTGLSGVALVNAGAKTMDGLDLSSGMLKVAAKTGIYRSLAPADLSKPIPDVRDEMYDVVACVGTLTHGHVKAVPALREFVRVVKRGGYIAATILDDIWESDGYAVEVKSLEEQGLVEVVSTASKDYRKAAGVCAMILVLRKL